MPILCLIPIVGGLLIMMGQHDRAEVLFYYFRLEGQVSENHLLRLIEKHISFEFVRERLRNSLHEPARQRARGWRTRQSSLRHSGKESKVEALFAELKNQIGLRR